MIEIKADGENIKIKFDCTSKAGVIESISLMATLIQSLAKEWNIEDIVLAESLFGATKEYLQWEEKKKR